MAKKRNKVSKQNKSYRKTPITRNTRRVVKNNANRSRLPLYSVAPSKSYLTEIEDLRSFNPTRSLVGYSGTVVKDNRNTRPLQTKAPLRFRHPERVIVCVRRGIRREVMFAKNKAGLAGQKRPTYNFQSRISCRR